MNQIAAALLIVSASVFGHIAAIRPDNDGFGGLMSLIALGLGFWGAMSLLITSTRERAPFHGEPTNAPFLGGLAANGLRGLSGPYRSTAGSRHAPGATGEYRLTAETTAQIHALAKLRGQDRHQVVEETLRRHLPRAASGRVA